MDWEHDGAFDSEEQVKMFDGLAELGICSEERVKASNLSCLGFLMTNGA